MKAVIMAGGTGSRLWPLSRQARPKQFNTLTGDKTLLEETVGRLTSWLKPDDIYFSTGPAFVREIKKLMPDLKDSHIIVEPEKRDTGPAMGLVAAVLSNNFPDESVGFFPSDHFIEDSPAFLNAIRVADKLIKETGKMIDIGVRPTFPNINLGYTKIEGTPRRQNGFDIFDFAGHVEKPPFEQAQKYIQSGNFLWHASYYMWTPAKFLEAFRQAAPEAHGQLIKIKQLASQNDWTGIRSVYAQLPKTSFDYLVTEKIDPRQVLIIKGQFGWSDIGSWDSIFERIPKDSSGNALRATAVTVESSDNLIFAPAGKLVAAVGLKDIVIVDTGDALLVCAKDQAPLVKKLVEKLKETGYHNELI